MRDSYPSQLKLASNPFLPTYKQRSPLRAIIEIRGGELKVFPLAETDVDAAKIMDALRFIMDDK